MRGSADNAIKPPERLLPPGWNKSHGRFDKVLQGAYNG
jgi:hypothetical protein